MALPEIGALAVAGSDNVGVDWPADLVGFVGYDRAEWLRRYPADEDYWIPSPLHDPGDPCKTCEAYYQALRMAWEAEDRSL